GVDSDVGNHQPQSSSVAMTPSLAMSAGRTLSTGRVIPVTIPAVSADIRAEQEYPGPIAVMTVGQRQLLSRILAENMTPQTLQERTLDRTHASTRNRPRHPVVTADRRAPVEDRHRPPYRRPRSHRPSRRELPRRPALAAGRSMA